MRRRPDAGEHHAAGGEPEGPAIAARAAGHQDQYQPDRLLSVRVAAPAEIRRQAVGALRERDRVAGKSGRTRGTGSVR